MHGTFLDKCNHNMIAKKWQGSYNDKNHWQLILTPFNTVPCHLSPSGCRN